MSLWTIITTIVFMTAIAFAATTFAAPLGPAGPPAAAVSFTDLDLGSEAGATVALARVDRAVLATCGEAPAAPSRADAYRRCASSVIEPALAALGEPVVSAIDTHNSDLLMFVASR